MISTTKRLALSASLLLAAAGCASEPDDLREWRPEDHRNTENPSTGQVTADDSQRVAATPPGLEDVTIVAWRRQCVRCHGQIGAGDGPEGRMVRATNLTDPSWQASVTDAQIASTIRQGKGAMPSFDLPASTVDSLVKLVRLLNRNRTAPPAGSASAAPAASSGASPAPGAPSTSAASAQSPPVRSDGK